MAPLYKLHKHTSKFLFGSVKPSIYSFLYISRILFLILMAFLPLDWSFKFYEQTSYIDGWRVEYLILRISLQDILIIALLCSWFLYLFLSKIFVNTIKSFVGYRIFQIGILMLYTFSISLIPVYNSFFFNSSLFEVFRWWLYFGLFWYVYWDFKSSVNFLKRLLLLSLSFWLVLLSIWGLMQLIHQGSLFNNYLFLGELRYTKSTTGVLLERIPVLNIKFVPAYGIFRHPNIFSGFLVVSITFLLTQGFNFGVIFLGMLGLFSTWSLSAFFTFLFIVFYRYFIMPKLKHTYLIHLFWTSILISIPLLIYFIGYLLPVALPTYSKFFFVFPAFFRRYFLMKETLSHVSLFGNGWLLPILRNFTNVPYMSHFKFQPVHNIYLLILDYAGVFGLFIFLSFIFSILKLSTRSLSFPFLVLILLGCFDHYIITIPHMLLLFWLISAYIFTVSHKSLP